MHPDLPLNQILFGDCRELLKTLPDESVHCIVTSPPYWGLRSYGTDPQVWTNGHEPCAEHQWGDKIPNFGGAGNKTPSGFQQKSQAGQTGALAQVAWSETNRGDTCSICGAWRGELGLEPTPELYVEHLTQIFREVKRVLRDDGVAWINLGDSYAAGTGATRQQSSNPGVGANRPEAQNSVPRNGISANLGNSLYRLIESGLIFLAGSGSLTIASKSEQILKGNAIAPDLELTRLLGVKRILFKKRDDDFCQVLNLLDAKCDCWISAAVPFTAIDDATLEIVIDELNGIRVIVADDDLKPTTPFRVLAIGANAREYAEVGFTVTESGEPTTKVFRNIQATGDTSTFDSFGEGFLQVDAIDKAIALADAFDARSGGLRDFRVTKAGFEHLALALMGGAVELAFLSVGHLFISNKFGSLVRYGELYDKAKRMSNASQAKQLIGIPWMVARALQEDGWILRSDCIWAKPNPMPESVTDRPTKSHEYIFLLSKSQKYYYDSDAVAEESTESSGWSKQRAKGDNTWKYNGTSERIAQTGQRIESSTLGTIGKRNRRTVWTVATHPYRQAHFATYPPKLIEPCILAGTSARGVCSKCGAPWERVIERHVPKLGIDIPVAQRHKNEGSARAHSETSAIRVSHSGNWSRWKAEHPNETTGWRPTCDCDAGEPVPAVVLDPFMGSGTTASVCISLKRDYIGFDLNPAYVEGIAQDRADNTPPPLFVL